MLHGGDRGGASPRPMSVTADTMPMPAAAARAPISDFSPAARSCAAPRSSRAQLKARRRAFSCARLLRGAAQERAAGEKSEIGARAAAAGIGIVSAVTDMGLGDAPPRSPPCSMCPPRCVFFSSSAVSHRPCRRGQVRRLRRGGGRGCAARRRARHAGRVLLAAPRVVPEDGAERLDLRPGR